MSVELLYTSAPSGLRQGSRGFCTVLTTYGTPSNLAVRLEGLSGYRHLFSPQAPEAERNPVCWSHLRFSVGGQPTNVVSRIAAYGVDYSGRTNKLAHHLVLAPHEQPTAGPTWLLMQPGVMRSSWDGENQTPPTGPNIPTGQQSGSVCERWAKLTGDAGWGGVVAEVLANACSRPLWIVHSLDQQEQLLALLNESIAILSPQQRWMATFSTYYTNLPPEVDCRVRCVLTGTEEARVAKTRGSVIDLTLSLPKATPTPYAHLARGEQTAADNTDSAREVSDEIWSPEADTFDDTLGSEQLVDSNPDQDVHLAPETISPTHSVSSIPPPVSLRKRRRRYVSVVLASLSLLALVGVSFAAYPLIRESFIGSDDRRTATVDPEPASTEVPDENVAGLDEKMKGIENELKALRLRLVAPGLPKLPIAPRANLEELPATEVLELSEQAVEFFASVSRVGPPTAT